MADPEILFEVNAGDRVTATEVPVDTGPQIQATVAIEDQAVELEVGAEQHVETAIWNQEIPFNFVPVKGPKGDPGPPGTVEGAFEGTAWWTGQGVPDVVMGSKPGDYYIDTDTGTIYKLGD